MSADIYSTWPQLIRKLCIRCHVNVPEDKMDDVNTLLSLADQCKSNPPFLNLCLKRLIELHYMVL